MTKSKWVKKIRTCSDKRLRNSNAKTANLRNWPTILKKCSRIQMIKVIRRKRKNQRRKKRRKIKKKRKRRIKSIKRRRSRMRRTMHREGYEIATKRIKRRSTMPRSSSRKSSKKMIKQ